MDELSKVRRVMDRQVPGAPHEVLLVLDASTGQNAVRQAEAFTEAVEVTGLVLTKLDGTAKGGIAIGISNDFKVPVKYIGVGEKVDDLQVFDRSRFVEALFGDRPDGPTVLTGRITSPTPPHWAARPVRPPRQPFRPGSATNRPAGLCSSPPMLHFAEWASLPPLSLSQSL